MRVVAAIDVGTNTILMLIAKGPPLARVADRARIERLGQGLDRTGALEAAAIARALDCLREYRLLADAAGAEIAAVGTQALREAANARDFLAPARAIVGAEIEVVSGEREALLAWRAVHESFPELDDAIVMDVGGGSTEFVIARGGEVEQKASVRLGSVRLFERGGDLVRTIDETLAPLGLPRGLPLVGTAGTVTTLAALHAGIDPYDPDRVHGMRLSRADVAWQLGRLAALTAPERRKLRGLDPARADVIVAGATIVLRTMAILGAHELVVSDRGIRWGLASERLSVLASSPP
jgi:exopolyphosphatase / guanosine-5'-triphosphate,3'-diphosphate pyrophosphatase